LTSDTRTERKPKLPQVPFPRRAIEWGKGGAGTKVQKKKLVIEEKQHKGSEGGGEWSTETGKEKDPKAKGGRH